MAQENEAQRDFADLFRRSLVELTLRLAWERERKLDRYPRDILDQLLTHSFESASLFDRSDLTTGFRGDVMKAMRDASSGRDDEAQKLQRYDIGEDVRRRWAGLFPRSDTPAVVEAAGLIGELLDAAAPYAAPGADGDRGLQPPVQGSPTQELAVSRSITAVDRAAVAALPNTELLRAAENYQLSAAGAWFAQVQGDGQGRVTRRRGEAARQMDRVDKLLEVARGQALRRFRDTVFEAMPAEVTAGRGQTMERSWRDRELPVVIAHNNEPVAAIADKPSVAPPSTLRNVVMRPAANPLSSAVSAGLGTITTVPVVAHELPPHERRHEGAHAGTSGIGTNTKAGHRASTPRDVEVLRELLIERAR